VGKGIGINREYSRVEKVENNMKEYIEEFAIKRGLTFGEAVRHLAAVFGLNRTYIYAILNGHRQPSSNLMFAIARFFEADVEDIFFPKLSSFHKREDGEDDNKDTA